MEYKIKNLKLKNRFLLAPMLEPNDIAFRLLCKKAGCGLTYTGMTSPLSKQKLHLDDKPALQLFGNSERGVKEFIKKYDKNVSLWDFNLGCPSKLSKKSTHGAFMHEDFEAIKKILKAMKESTKKPITIKLRKSEYAIEIAKLAEKYVDAIGIHSRTIQQGYSGEVDYDFALKLKSSVSVPVIFSGNIDEKNAKKILKDFDFVFIGRGAIGDPEIFARLINKTTKIKFADYIKLAKKYKLFFRQVKYQAMNFTKGLANAKEIRKGLIEAKAIEDIEKAMKTNK
ncbi:MAG: tRNA-dihydrouridine synthase family protein [Nanoarchaeota archaeon]|nr:tRNA-dihydrouridine synthase family protein [Nanoarchaeota archaeon]